MKIYLVKYNKKWKLSTIVLIAIAIIVTIFIILYAVNGMGYTASVGQATGLTFDPTKPWKVSATLKIPSGTPGGDMTLCIYFPNATKTWAFGGFELGVNASGTLFVDACDITDVRSTINMPIGTGMLSAGTPVVWAYDGTNVSFTVNGVAAGSMPCPLSRLPTTIPLAMTTGTSSLLYKDLIGGN
jgi:hypothetical protein